MAAPGDAGVIQGARGRLGLAGPGQGGQQQGQAAVPRKPENAHAKYLQDEAGQKYAVEPPQGCIEM